MSNPSINRWGLNLFWHKLWYSDTKYQNYLQQDDIFTQLLYTYLFYGLFFFYKNIYINNYWYKKKYNFKLYIFREYEEKMFRHAEFTDPVFHEKSLQKMRLKISQIYYSRIWIFRYQNWLILNFYNYKPKIKSRENKFLIKQNLYSNAVAKFDQKILYLKRLKIFTSLITNMLFKKHYNYRF